MEEDIVKPHDGKSTPPLVYDSGQYSSNTSDAGTGADSEHSPSERFQSVLREKDQALFLAVQDVRKLRSELERLHKSEQWYKQELRVQKNTRLEALERLYAQERKYMQENQRLQRECVRLYEKCNEMEQDLEAQREKALKQLEEEKANAENVGNNETTSRDSQDFELEQQRALIDDQQQLISVLRKQKRALLEDLKKLTREKDEKILELQQTLANMEVENTRITSKCKQLLNERSLLDEQLKSKESATQAEVLEKLELQALADDTKAQLSTQTQLLALKETEILDLQNQFKANLKNESDVDEVHRLSMAYHAEINAKTAEIATLKNSLMMLQQELNSLAELQTQNEQQERHIENLNFTLEARQFELEKLQQTDAVKAEQIAELQLNLEHLRGERATMQEQLALAQLSFKSVEKELIVSNTQYAEICALCERTRFQLEMCEIEQGKLKFQVASEQREIEQLREKLKDYLQQTEMLSKRINYLELQLEQKNEAKAMLKRNLHETEERLEAAEAEVIEITARDDEDSADESIINSLQGLLEEKEAAITSLHAENLHLKTLLNGTAKQSDLPAAAEDDTILLDDCNKLSKHTEQLLQNIEAQGEFIAKKQRLLDSFEGDTSRVSNDFSGEDLQTFARENQRLIELINVQNEFIAQKQKKWENFKAGVSVEAEALHDEQLAELTAQHQSLLENISVQSEFITTKQKLQERFDSNIDSNALSLKADDNNKANMEILSKQQPDVSSADAEKLENLELLSKRLKKKFQEQGLEMQKLQQKLLESDGELYRLQKMQATEEELESRKQMLNELKEKNERLQMELDEAKEIEKQQKETENELREELLANKKEDISENELKMISEKLQRYEQLFKNEDELLQYLKENVKLYAHLEKHVLGRVKNTTSEEETLGTAKEIPETNASSIEVLPNDGQLIDNKSNFNVNTNSTTEEMAEKSAEIAKLQNRVRDLEQQLQSVKSTDEAKREERIKLINKLLEQQSVKVNQLNSTQAEWEDLLKALNTTQQLEEKTRQELALKRAELEELNELFAAQNEELQQLHEYAFRIEQKSSADEVKSRETFQQQINVMQEQLSDRVKECAQQKCTIETLNCKNERLEERLNEDYANELVEHKKQLRTLQANLEKLTQERDACATRVEELESELMELKRGKREAVLMPELVFFNESSTESEAGEDLKMIECFKQIESTRVDQPVNDDDRLRILTKVLESEYKRKMKRYDLHIRTLLQNVKGLKKALRLAEEKAMGLSMAQAKTADETRNLQLTKRHLEELRLKYEQSQCTIKTLEQTLAVERKKFEASDMGKSAQNHEGTHEVANLIDDYKKLIQQSAIATKRPKTIAILELIQRSNQCVPNLHKLESTVEDLRSDIQQFIDNCAQNVGQALTSNATLKVPSLLDELRAATQNI